MRGRALASGILAATVLSLMWAPLGPTPASAATDTPTPGLNFYIAVDGVPNCNTKTTDAACSITLGTTFVIDAYLDHLPTGILNYAGFDVSLRHSGVTPNPEGSTDVWPDCGFVAAAAADTVTCVIGVPPAAASTYVGLMATFSFVCAQSGSVSMIHGEHQTDLVSFDNIGVIYAEDGNTTETLTINCVQGGVTPIPTTPSAGSTTALPGTPQPTAQSTATPTAKAQATVAAKPTATSSQPGAGTSGDGGLSGGVIAIIVVAAVVVAGGVGIFGLALRRGVGGDT